MWFIEVYKLAAKHQCSSVPAVVCGRVRFACTISRRDCCHLTPASRTRRKNGPSVHHRTDDTPQVQVQAKMFRAKF